LPELKLENSIVDDRYRVLRCLSRGSYSEIFLAEDLEHANEQVIIKALNTTLQGTLDHELEQTLVQNFQNEAVALDKVRHPHIIQRLGHGTAADLHGTAFHYLVLEYMQGGDLLSLCRGRPLDLSGALFYFKQVAEGLAFAHSRQVIHRDVKPNNLLLSSDQRTVKIADFGVAKISLGDEAEITRVGTSVYSPPEHHPDSTDSHANEKLTPSADIYSLAKTIYTAMSGKAPHHFSRSAITALPESLSRAQYGAQLLAVLEKATRSNPAERHQRIEDFWDEIARLGATQMPQPSTDSDPDATLVRPRAASMGPLVIGPGVVKEIPAASFVAPAAAGPITGEIPPRKAQIVVELPSRADGHVPEHTGFPREPASTTEAAAITRPALEAPERTSRHPEIEIAMTREAASDEASVLQQAVSVSSEDGKKGIAPASSATKVIAAGTTRALVNNLSRANWTKVLSRTFGLLLLMAFVGLTISTYYYFADPDRRPPWSGLRVLSSANDGSINGATNVNLRSEPAGEALVWLPQGTRVRVLETRGNWHRIRVIQWLGGQPSGAPDAGWVDRRYVKLD